jgi:hypothetical protein
MIIFLRGHIRNAFSNGDLLDLIKRIKCFHKGPLKIYIHTWSIFSSDISWRNIRKDERLVKPHKIINYFGNLKHCIKNIVIEDDTKIEIYGNKDGNICSSLCPVIAWKYMWHGKYSGIKAIKENSAGNEYVINMRFDILNNSFSKTSEDIIRFVHAKRNLSDFKKNIFMNDNIDNINQIRGVDNFYIGSVDTMNILIEHFYENLDRIVLKYPENKCQESLVYMENKIIFKEKTLREKEEI